MVSGCSLITLLHSQLFSLMLATTLMFNPPHTSRPLCENCVFLPTPQHYWGISRQCWSLSHVTNNNSIQDRALAEVVNQAIPKCSRQDKYNWQSVCSRCTHITQTQLTWHHVPVSHRGNRVPQAFWQGNCIWVPCSFHWSGKMTEGQTQINSHPSHSEHPFTPLSYPWGIWVVGRTLTKDIHTGQAWDFQLLSKNQAFCKSRNCNSDIETHLKIPLATVQHKHLTAPR